MRQAEVRVNGIRAGVLIEHSRTSYEFTYDPSYSGAPVSLTMPRTRKVYRYSLFPAFFEGLLPEGAQLESLLRDAKVSRDDQFSQLMICGTDCVGSVSVHEVKE